MPGTYRCAYFLFINGIVTVPHAIIFDSQFKGWWGRVLDIDAQDAQYIKPDEDDDDGFLGIF